MGLSAVAAPVAPLRASPAPAGRPTGPDTTTPPAAAAHPHYEPIALYQLGHYHRLGLGGLTKNVTRALNYYFEADYRCGPPAAARR